MPQNCPTLSHYSAADECLENLAGLGEVAYIGLRSSLKADALTATGDTYAMSASPFKDGAPKLFKLDLKEESQKVAGESQGKRKGFNITGTMVFDAVNAKVAELARSLNNLDWFAIFPDGEEAQILYDPYKKIRIDSGGLTTDTGAAAGDERITTVNFILGPVKYPNLFVTLPSNTSWDDLLDEGDDSSE